MKYLAVWMMLIVVMGSALTLYAGDKPPAGTIAVEAPELARGESWTWSDRSETCLGEREGFWVFRVEGDRFSGERYRTKQLNLVKNVKDGASVNTHTPDAGLLSFPLYVGKEWGQSYLRRNNKRSQRFKVEAYEQVTTKAGSYNAFRISGIDRRLDNGFGTLVTVWYAPEVKNIVRMTGEDESNHIGIEGWSYELIDYRKPQ